MPSFKEVMGLLDQFYEQIMDRRQQLVKNMNLSLPKPQKDEMQQMLEAQISKLEKYKTDILEELVRYPPKHDRHFQLLQAFHNDGAFEKSVFIMTKFPDMQNPQAVDQELIRVIQGVKDAITARGFIPRIANAKKYHAALWDNVELYLLGCERGVAIVEDKYRKELNPNVTMEWGWMRGMNREVLYLVENNFIGERADIVGLLKDSFDWANPEPGITNAMNAWLK